MPKSKRFQSGREIFEHFIPNYEPENLDDCEVSVRAEKLAEAIIGEFAGQVSGNNRRQPNTTS